jgi:uncharacterized integral membrane protein
MIFSLIVAFLLLLMVVIASIQNTVSLDLKFITWQIQLPISYVIFYSSVLGGAIVAILTLPRLVSKYLKVRNLNKKIRELKKRSLDLEKTNMYMETDNLD